MRLFEIVLLPQAYRPSILSRLRVSEAKEELR